MSGPSASGAPEAQRTPIGAWEWALVVQIVIIACVVRVLWLDFDLDDSFITYTYSRSLAQGQGFVFAGQKALGTTTPLYALLLGVFHFVGLPMVETAKALGYVGTAASTVLIFLLGRAALGPIAGHAAAVLLAINSRHAAVSMSGMETSLYTAVCLGAFVAFYYDRPYWTAALASAGCLLRPDGVLLAGVLFVSHLAARRKLQIGPPLVFLVPIGLWIAYAFVEFGSPIPTSVAAKLAYPEYGPFRLEVAAGVLGEPLAVPLAVLAVCGLVHSGWTARALLPVGAWTALYLAAFLRAPNFPWYYVPPIPGLILMALAGIVAVLGILLPGEGRGWSAARGLASFGLAAAVGWFTVTDMRLHREWLSRVYGPEVTRCYHSLALWLRDNTLPDATVAVPEVGYIGYYSDRRVLDLAGLCSPQVIPYLPGRRYVEIVQDFQPDFVALTTEANRPIHNAISESGWFRTHYTGAVKFPYRGRWYIVWRKLSRPRPLPGGGSPPSAAAPAVPKPPPASPGSGRPSPAAPAAVSRTRRTR